MGDAEDLLAVAEGLELLTDRLRSAATDADVDLIEDQGARRGGSFSGFGGGFFDGDLQGQHNAAHFAAGSDFV